MTPEDADLEAGPEDAGQEAAQGDADLEALLRTAATPVILAFTAEWCAPCKWLDPYLDAFSARAGGRIAIRRVDTDRSPGLARSYRIGSVPTVVLIIGGAEVERSIGVEPERLSAWVDRVLDGEDTGARAPTGSETGG